MARDIHMFIVHHGNIIKSNIYEGRSPAWFDSITDKSELCEYEQLPIVFGWPEGLVPQELREKYSRERLYFDHYHIKVKYFKEWFEKYRPDIDAGWATTYQKWLIEKKGFRPGYLPDTLPNDANVADMHFIEFERISDKSRFLYEYLIENNIDGNDDIVYCFDN